MFSWRLSTLSSQIQLYGSRSKALLIISKTLASYLLQDSWKIMSNALLKDNMRSFLNCSEQTKIQALIHTFMFALSAHGYNINVLPWSHQSITQGKWTQVMVKWFFLKFWNKLYWKNMSVIWTKKMHICLYFWTPLLLCVPVFSL